MWWRIRMFSFRLVEFTLWWPVRLFRLCKWLLWINSARGKNSFVRWICGVVALVLDLIPLSLLYETLMDIVKPGTRPLLPEEVAITRSVFGDHLPVHLVSLDPGSIPVTKKKTKAYVSFHTINGSQDLPAHILVHELVHIWQYRKYGSVYISESLWAQKWGGGYNYGGLEGLMKYSQGAGLEAFNFEQQADIIEDYYRWKIGIPLQWALNVPGIGQVLEKYRKELTH